MKVISILCLMVVSTMAATTDPGQTAVDFLEKVRAKNLNLDPGEDTALSAQTSKSKRGQIARRLDRMARDLGDDPLEVGEVKLDGELAGVLVRKISGFDPGRMQVFPIALVKRGADWAVAPVPGSFENSGVGYAAMLRQRLSALEDWMLRGQVLDLAVLREQSAERMRRQIEKSLPAATLKKFDSRQAVDRFLGACQSRNLPEALGLLGGLSANPPDNWQLRLKAAESALGVGSKAGYPWRLLTSEDVLRVIVLHEEDKQSALVSIACLDPAGGMAAATRPRIKLVHLDLTKSADGLWGINPPAHFLQPAGDAVAEPDDGLDIDLLDKFPGEVSERYPASPRPTAEDARQAVMDALHDGSLKALIPLVRLGKDPAAARDTCVRAAQLWWSLREPSSVRRAVPLAIQEDGGKAAATFQFFSARNPDRMDFKVLYFEKSADGWLWAPKPKEGTEPLFREWVDLQAGQWRNGWQDVLLADCPVVGKVPDAGAPADGESRKLVEEWLEAVRSGDCLAALSFTARLDLPDSKTALLRNLGYELIGARKGKAKQVLTGFYRSGGWSAVGIRTESDGKPAFPLYPIIATESGPRILLEVDLSASGKRSRDYLNKISLERLSKADPEASKSLKDLFGLHQEEVVK